MAQLVLACDSVDECNTITAEAAKWRALCEYLKTRIGGAEAVAQGRVTSFIEAVLLKASIYDEFVKECDRHGRPNGTGALAWLREHLGIKSRAAARDMAAIEDECDRYARPAGMPACEFVASVFQNAKRGFEAVEQLRKLCKAHGMTEGQPISSFVNELAENLRSANDQLNEICDEFEPTFDLADEAGLHVSFIDCTFNVSK